MKRAVIERLFYDRFEAFAMFEIEFVKLQNGKFQLVNINVPLRSDVPDEYIYDGNAVFQEANGIIEVRGPQLLRIKKLQVFDNEIMMQIKQVMETAQRRFEEIKVAPAYKIACPKCGRAEWRKPGGKCKCGKQIPEPSEYYKVPVETRVSVEHGEYSLEHYIPHIKMGGAHVSNVPVILGAANRYSVNNKLYVLLTEEEIRKILIDFAAGEISYV
ncbi:hypothetical protein [uncultured Methanomethylovorans sp.]|uniref:hypothetical protein n=1 Tax=uncultured Methanomethylovorans sp. TaxID=183759 RepID=UPI002AA8FD0F|nr:hypothetical protein [uncultured Methanomethylovorans sp.]